MCTVRVLAFSCGCWPDVHAAVPVLATRVARLTQSDGTKKPGKKIRRRMIIMPKKHKAVVHPKSDLPSLVERPSRSSRFRVSLCACVDAQLCN